MALRPPKGVKGEFDFPVGAGGMARFLTRRGTVRGLSRIFKRAKAGTGSLEDVRDILKLKSVKETLKKGKKRIPTKAEKLRRSMTK